MTSLRFSIARGITKEPTFAEDLNPPAQEYGIHILTKYGKTLCEQAQSYNVDAVENMLLEFPELLEQLKLQHF